MQAQKQGEICELAWSNRTGRLRIENAAKHTQNRKHIVRPGREPGNDKRIRKVDSDIRLRLRLRTSHVKFRPKTKKFDETELNPQNQKMLSKNLSNELKTCRLRNREKFLWLTGG